MDYSTELILLILDISSDYYATTTTLMIAVHSVCSMNSSLLYNISSVSALVVMGSDYTLTDDSQQHNRPSTGVVSVTVLLFCSYCCLVSGSVPRERSAVVVSVSAWEIGTRVYMALVTLTTDLLYSSVGAEPATPRECLRWASMTSADSTRATTDLVEQWTVR